MAERDPREVYRRLARQDFVASGGGFLIVAAYAMFAGDLVDPTWWLYAPPVAIWIIASVVTHRRRSRYTCPGCGIPFYGRGHAFTPADPPCPVCGSERYWNTLG